MMLAGILGEDYRILEAENGKQCLELLRANAGADLAGAAGYQYAGHGRL